VYRNFHNSSPITEILSWYYRFRTTSFTPLFVP